MNRMLIKISITFAFVFPGSVGWDHCSGLSFFHGSFAGAVSSKVTLAGLPPTSSTLFIWTGCTMSRVSGSMETFPRGLLVPFQVERYFTMAALSVFGLTFLAAA